MVSFWSVLTKTSRILIESLGSPKLPPDGLLTRTQLLRGWTCGFLLEFGQNRKGSVLSKMILKKETILKRARAKYDRFGAWAKVCATKRSLTMPKINCLGFSEGKSSAISLT